MINKLHHATLETWMQAKFLVAFELMRACSAKACAFRVATRYSFTDMERVDS